MPRSALSQKVFSALSCDSYKKNYNSDIKWLEQEARKFDVSNIIGDLIIKHKKCGINSDLAVLESIRQVGYETEIKNTKARIMHYSRFRRVDEELVKFEKYVQRIGKNSSDIEAFIIAYRENGKISEKSEKQKCQPDYDLRNAALGEVRDQDSVGWCYAFVAADLLTYKLGQKISAIDIALNYNDTWLNYLTKKIMNLGDQSFDGGNEGEAIERIKAKGGACLESNFMSEDNAYASLFDNLKAVHSMKTKQGDAPACPSEFGVFHAFFPKVSSAVLERVFVTSPRENLMLELSKTACEPRLSLKNVKVEVKTVLIYDGLEKRIQLFDTIDEQLARKNIVGVAYNGELLHDSDYSKEGRSSHASVIVGRRFKNGECQYLVRNSYGAGCSSYAHSFSCEKGNIWVPKSVLTKSLSLGITYVE